jgi:hypothetical protein
MTDYYFSKEIDRETSLCIAPLTDKRVELSGEAIDDPSGYFLYEIKGRGEPYDVTIIAKLASEEAAFQLKEILQLT